MHYPETEYGPIEARIIHNGRRESVHVSDQFIKNPSSKVIFPLKYHQIDEPFWLVVTNHGSKRPVVDLETPIGNVPLYGRSRNENEPFYTTRTQPFLENWQLEPINVYDLVMDGGKSTLRVAVDTLRGEERIWLTHLANDPSYTFPARPISRLSWQDNFWIVEESLQQIASGNGYTNGYFPKETVSVLGKLG